MVFKVHIKEIVKICNSTMMLQTGKNYLDFNYQFEFWIECPECGFVTDVVLDTLDEEGRFIQ